MSSGPGPAIKRARWSTRGLRLLALVGVLIVMRQALRRARTRRSDTGADRVGTASETAPNSREPALDEPGSEAGGGAPPAGESLGDADVQSGPPPKHGALHAMVALVVLLACAAVAIPLAASGTPRAHSVVSTRKAGDARHSTDPPRAETVTSDVPASGTTGVVPDTTIAVTFSDPLAPGSPEPSLSPAVAGSWQIAGSEMLFTPSASFVPSTKYTVTVPGGPSGVQARSGLSLGQTLAFSFTIAPGSVPRLQQLLATLGYLPLEFSGPSPTPAEMAMTQPGAFVWRSKDLPTEYTSEWSPTRVTALTKGALMAFETQNGLAVNGTAGAAVWSALLADVAAGKKDGQPVTYVLVTKSLPEHLTVWVNGKLTFADVPCNTGVPGAPTTDGTFEVFEHVQVSNMRGTDITGTSYDVTVPWASYFDGGEALHGYPRASYGFPQSNGCVEMPISTAGIVWPSTPIGTVVTVVGPTA